MKRMRHWSIGAGLGALTLALAACGQTPAAPRSTSATTAAPLRAQGERAAAVPGQYIVVLRPQANLQVAGSAQRLLAAGGQLRRSFQRLGMFSATLSAAQAAALAGDPEVQQLSANLVVQANRTQVGANWGLDRIDQRILPLNQTYRYSRDATGVHAYIIDTGIRTSHQEFGGRASVATDTIGDGQNGADCNGHGTHVAGTLGGQTYGVAKNVTLHAVRVLDCGGSGSFESVIAGVEWVTANRVAPAVANMSLGGADPGGQNTALDLAVQRSIASGVPYVIAAGNTGEDAANQTPARVPSAITVAASTPTDARADFSNVGAVVDLFAPGLDIVSAWISDDTATRPLSGTSMAAPHVAGAVAQLLQSRSQLSPAAIEATLVADGTPGLLADTRSAPNRLLHTGLINLNVSGDFDGDGLADPAVYRRENPLLPGGEPTWMIRQSSDDQERYEVFGLAKDVPVACDYDGDGRSDVAVWRPGTGFWYAKLSASGQVRALQWGKRGDVAVPADYDGDDRCDFAVWRPDDGTWYIWQSSTGAPIGRQFGQAGDRPLPADYDGDGKADLMVFRAIKSPQGPATGQWIGLLSAGDQARFSDWGLASDQALPADYDGDGKADLAVRRASDNVWYILSSSTGQPRYGYWGLPNDVAVVSDYDRDGRADLAIWRPGAENGGLWALQKSGGGEGYVNWGLPTDTPVTGIDRQPR